MIVQWVVVQGSDSTGDSIGVVVQGVVVHGVVV